MSGLPDNGIHHVQTRNLVLGLTLEEEIKSELDL